MDIARTIRALAAVGALVGMMTAVAVAGTAPDPRGAWRLERYTGGGSVGPATGQLILAGGRFSLVYTMTGADGTLSGRAHAGSYRVDGDTLALGVEWSMDHVNGKGAVAPRPSTRAPGFRLEGDRLTLTYENGAIQVFERIGRAE